MNTRLYIDECGYTGEDLFNPEQPIFCLASTAFPEDKCQELKKKYFSKVKAQELKHSRLVKYPAQQEMVIDFLTDLVSETDSVKYVVVHKRFVLLTKMVDLIVEPLAHEDGIDLYKDGFNIAYSNILYYVIRSRAGEAFFLSMIKNFQQMMRDRSLPAYEAFFRPFFDRQFPKSLEDLLIFFKASHIKHGPSILDRMPLNSLDIAFAETFTLVSIWSSSLEGDIVLVHDKSSPMAKNKAIWERVVSPEVPEKVVGYDRRKWHFPIRVVRTDLADSKDFAGLQIVDILAGAMTRCMKWVVDNKPAGDLYAEKLSTFLPESFGAHLLWPSPEFTPEELGTTGPDADDPIQHYMELIRDLIK